MGFNRLSIDSCYIQDKVKCICESQNGVPGNNGILCNVNGSFDNVSSCNDYQWCTGPATNHSAIIGSAKLCEFGIF